MPVAGFLPKLEDQHAKPNRAGKTKFLCAIRKSCDTGGAAAPAFFEE
jgi:hypothetical protein